MSNVPRNPVPGWDVPRDYYAPDEPGANEESFDEMVEERMSMESESFEEGFKIKMKEYRKLLAAAHRYDVLMAQYIELQDAAMKVIENTNEILDTEPWPTKFRAPYGALAHLQKVLTGGYGLRRPPNLPQEGENR